MSAPIPVVIEIEFLLREEDVFKFRINVEVLGSTQGDFECNIDTYFYEQPRVTDQIRDHFGLFPSLRDRFAVALYELMHPHLVNANPDYPFLVEIIDPDLRPWLNRNFYSVDASRLARVLSAKVNPAAQRPGRRQITCRID